ncbi:MAG: hypothetical protein JJE09_09685 [Bacteroidia bacterium]|nr:hypothetical protein [Bacteroidia bacterium]
MDSTSSDHLFESFGATTKNDWLAAAKLELGGADPYKKLTSKKGGLTILPYFDRDDALKDHFQLKPAQSDFLGARAFLNMPGLSVINESESNRKALSELNAGADGIIFNINNPKTNIPALLEKIEWAYCGISFAGEITEQFLNSLHSYAGEKKFDVGTFTGCVFTNRSQHKIEILKLFENWANFHPLGIELVEKESTAEEIASALAKAVKQIDLITDHGLSVKQALKSIAFHMPVGEDFFLTIAKLKVLRILWNNVVKQFDPQSNLPIFIHTTSMPWIKKVYQPNSNLIKSTTAAIAAILGGCDALTIIPEDDNNPMTQRVARNVSSVLRDESQLSRVADPTAGSYYLEHLIDQLAEQTWGSFKKQVNS